MGLGGGGSTVVLVVGVDKDDGVIQSALDERVAVVDGRDAVAVVLMELGRLMTTSLFLEYVRSIVLTAVHYCCPWCVLNQSLIQTLDQL